MASGTDEKQPGRPPTLEREQILAAAAEIPLKDFSVRAVADRLRVSPQSIYYYFENKTSLLGAMASEALLDLPQIEASDWRGYFRQSLLGYRAWVMASESPARLPVRTIACNTYANMHAHRKHRRYSKLTSARVCRRSRRRSGASAMTPMKYS